MDRFGEHALVTDAGEADLILFVDLHQHLTDWTMRTLRHHPLVREFPDKAFVYDERDVPRDALPGIYVAMPRAVFDVQRHCAFGYYRLMADTRTVANDEPDLLFSFLGRRVRTVRDDMLGLSHPRAIVEDTSAYDFFGPTHRGLTDARNRYREVLGRSKFVLCPRGAGVASMRLFETLACGRVPVVLSDDWVPPAGIDWESCSVRIPEHEAGAVAGHLEALEPHWPTMSAGARRVYDEWFAPDVWFHRAVELCGELLENGATGLRRQWTHPVIWRDGARLWKSKAVRAARSSRGIRSEAEKRERA